MSARFGSCKISSATSSYAASAFWRPRTRYTIIRIESVLSVLWRAEFLPCVGTSLGSTRRLQIELCKDDFCIDGAWFVGKESVLWKRDPSAALSSCNGRVCRACVVRRCLSVCKRFEIMWGMQGIDDVRNPPTGSADVDSDVARFR